MDIIDVMLAKKNGGKSYTKSETDALLADKQDTYTADSTAWDTAPTENSTNPVTSGGVYTALTAKADLATTAKTFKIADLYDASSGTYAVGDTCVESGILYLCKTAVTVAEVFDSSKWDAVTNTNGLFYIQPITTAAHTALLTKDSYTYYAIF